MNWRRNASAVAAALLLLAGAPALACPPPAPDPVPAAPDTSRHEGEGEAAYQARIEPLTRDFERQMAQYTARQEAKRVENERLYRELTERLAADEERTWDGAGLVLLARIKGVSGWKDHRHVRVSYFSERALKGKGRPTRLQYLALAPLNDCSGTDRGISGSEGGKYLIFLPDADAPAWLNGEQIFPVEYLHSERVKAAVGEATLK